MYHSLVCQVFLIIISANFVGIESVNVSKKYCNCVVP